MLNLKGKNFTWNKALLQVLLSNSRSKLCAILEENDFYFKSVRKSNPSDLYLYNSVGFSFFMQKEKML